MKPKHTSILNIALVVMGVSIASFLMFRTFSYDQKAGLMLMGSTVWSDFGSHVPLVRSFSEGRNWPVQNPVFPGEPIRYHFLFFLIAGLLERAGLRIDWALNLPSIAGFFGLMAMIYLMAKRVFSGRKAAVLSVLFFLFNGSLTFVEYFVKHGISPESIANIFVNKSFTSFGPWNGSPIAAFWSLNIYTNQRHLAPAFAIALLSIYIALFRAGFKWSLLISVCLGTLMFMNQPAFLIAVLYLSFIFLFQKQSRITIVTAAAFSVPFLVLCRMIIYMAPSVVFDPGFLIGPNKLNYRSFFNYWFANLGFYIILAPISMIFAPRKARIFIIPTLILFILTNIFRFSTDMINNHKFINFFLIMSGMFVASFLIRLLKYKTAYFAIPVIVFVLTFSGIIEAFPTINNIWLTVKDAPADPAVQFVMQNTDRKALFLNLQEIYNPASLAGRPIFNGYFYYTWSHGHRPEPRTDIMRQIYGSQDVKEICTLLNKYRISYVEVSNAREGSMYVNPVLWRNQFEPDFVSSENLRFINVKKICQ